MSVEMISALFIYGIASMVTKKLFYGSKQRTDILTSSTYTLAYVLKMMIPKKRSIGSSSRLRRAIVLPCICFINATATAQLKTARAKK